MARCDQCHWEFNIHDKDAWLEGYDYLTKQMRFLCPNCNSFYARSMTAEQLIKALQEYDPRMPVVIGCRSHPSVVNHPVSRYVNIRRANNRDRHFGDSGPVVWLEEEERWVEEATADREFLEKMRIRDRERLRLPFERWKQEKK